MLLLGMKKGMSFSDDKTRELFMKFMPRRNEIHSISEDVYCVQIFENPKVFENFNPELQYEKWAAMAVRQDCEIPDGMEVLPIPQGQYLHFVFSGSMSDFSILMGDLISRWMPKNGWQLDARPQFQVMGEKYKNNDPSSEEDVFVPVCPIGTI